MSSKKGRTPKAKKQAAKGASGPPEIDHQQIDYMHNLSIPSSQMLRNISLDIFPTMSMNPEEMRPTSLLGQMLRHQLLEERRKEVTSGSGAEETPNKKKKKKKKKKSKATAPTKAEENDVLAAESEPPRDLEAQTQAPNHLSLSKSNAASETGISPITAHEVESIPTSSDPLTPGELFLDRYLRHHEKEMENLEPNPTIQRNIQDFLQHLNGRFQDGITFPQTRLEVACKSIACEACSAAVDRLLQQNVKQPYVLDPISFHGASTDKTTCISSLPNERSEANGGTEKNKKQNGLEVPILKQTADQAKAQAQSLDFDYVALEEGTHPMETIMEAKAQLHGKPYFYRVTQLQQEDNKTVNGKKQPRGGEHTPPKQQQQQQQDSKWEFVPANRCSRYKDNSLQDTERKKQQLTLQDLLGVVKDTIIPLAVPPDELLGTQKYDASVLRKVLLRAQEKEREFDQKIKHVRNEMEHYSASLTDLWKEDIENKAVFQGAPAYHDLDDAIHSLLEEVVMEILWDKLLWLNRSESSWVVRSTPMWEDVMAFMADISVKVIMGVMQSADTFERELEDISNSQGAIPHLFLNQTHRVSYRAMIEMKLRLLSNFIDTIEKTSLISETALHSSKSVIPGQNKLVMPFRRKWFTQQELHREIEKGKKENLAADGAKEKRENNKGAETSNILGYRTKGDDMSERWLHYLDMFSADIIRGLLEFSKTVRRGRVWEIKEEHMVQGLKLIGLIAKVGHDCFRPLVHESRTSGSSPGNFYLKDSYLRSQCQELWAQIEQQRTYLQAAVQGQEEGADAQLIDEHKKVVTNLGVATIKLLRRLRKYVTDHYESQAGTGAIPLDLLSHLCPVHELDFDKEDLATDSYDNLVSMLVRFGQQQYCRGDGGQLRLTSLLVALFYQTLSEHCSEWNAELAEQELLKTMSNGDDKFESATSSSVSASSTKRDLETVQTKASKKSKKKKDRLVGPSSALREMNTPEQLPNNESGSRDGVENAVESTKDPTEDNLVEYSCEKDKLDDQININEVSHGKDKKTGKKRLENKSENHSSGMIQNNLNGTASKKESKTLQTQGASKTEGGNQGTGPGKRKTNNCDGTSFIKSIPFGEAAFNAVDEELGIRDGTGVFHTAESFLVGRLNALLKEVKTDEPSTGGPTVVIT